MKSPLMMRTLCQKDKCHFGFTASMGAGQHKHDEIDHGDDAAAEQEGVALQMPALKHAGGRADAGHDGRGQTCDESIDASTPWTQLTGTCTLVTLRCAGGRSTKGSSGKRGGASPWPSQTQTMPPASRAV